MVNAQFSYFRSKLSDTRGPAGERERERDRLRLIIERIVYERLLGRCSQCQIIERTICRSESTIYYRCLNFNTWINNWINAAIQQSRLIITLQKYTENERNYENDKDSRDSFQKKNRKRPNYIKPQFFNSIDSIDNPIINEKKKKQLKIPKYTMTKARS